jgi:hypothetical protein
MLKAFKAIITAFGITVAGMAGGQGKLGGKAPRRFGISAIALLSGGIKRGWPFLLFLPVLIMGYGENSVLMGLLNADWLVRIVYGLLLSLPFFFFGWRRGAFALVLLPIAFSIRAGSFGHVGWFGDVLIGDIIRYGALGGLVSFNIFFKKK